MRFAFSLLLKSGFAYFLVLCCFCSSVFFFLGCDFAFAGLFMALQPRIIACGNSIAAFAMAVRFLTGPAVMAAASMAVGLRGTLLHVAIVQVTSLSFSLLPLLTQPKQMFQKPSSFYNNY